MSGISAQSDRGILQHRLYKARFSVAIMAVRVIEHRTQNPPLIFHIPIAPRIARDVRRAAPTTNYLDSLSFLFFAWHQALIAMG